MATAPEKSLPLEEEAFAAEYSRLVSRLVRPYFLQGGDQDDLYQEGMIGLLKAIRSYDPRKNDHFEAYAVLCIRRQLYDAIRRSAKGALPQGGALLHPETAQVVEFDPETQVLASETEEEIKAALQGILSVFEGSVLTPYLEGYSVREIAERLGCTAKSASNAVLRIRRKLAQYLAQGENR